MVNNRKIKVVETFSGIGAQAKALKNINAKYEIVNTADWDIMAILSYFAIHKDVSIISKYESIPIESINFFLKSVTLSSDGKKPMSERAFCALPEKVKRYLYAAIKECKNLVNISDVKGRDIKAVDLLTYSFPCQDLSLCGAWTGGISGISRLVHNRSGLLWEIERILLEMDDNKQNLPNFLLMENVPSILSPRHMKDFQEWQKTLENLGYYNKVYVLDARNFGRLQKRRRAYMISVKCKNKKQYLNVAEYFKNNNLEDISCKKNNKRGLKDVLKIDYRNKIYYEEALSSTPNDTPSREIIYKNNVHLFHKNQIYDDFVDCVTTKQDRNPNSGTIDLPKNLYRKGKTKWRFLTPRECFILMGFTEDDFSRVKELNEKLSSNKKLMSPERMVKLAGNSIVVDVLEALFLQVLEINEKILHGEKK